MFHPPFVGDGATNFPFGPPTLPFHTSTIQIFMYVAGSKNNASVNVHQTIATHTDRSHIGIIVAGWVLPAPVNWCNSSFVLWFVFI